MASLGLACIVKNEEKVLSRLLTSVKDVVDQIVIVDTGSTDKTVEIAKSFGAEVYYFKWIDDFSAARNESFKYITTDYTLWLDADDIVYPEDAKKIKELIQNPTADQYLLTYHYAHNDKGEPILSLPRERIVKTSLNLKWEEPIHEYLPLVQNRISRLDISIHHFKTAENGQNTATRNISILEKTAKSGRASGRTMFYLGKEYFDSGQFDKAKEVLEDYLQNYDDWIINKSEAHQRLAKIAINNQDFSTALLQTQLAFNIEPKKPEILCLFGQINMALKNYQQAVKYYHDAIEDSHQGEWSFSHSEYKTFIPNLQLCLLYYQLGNYSKAKKHHQLAKKANPKHPSVIHNEEFLKKLKSGRQSIVFVHSLKNILKTKHWVEVANQLTDRYEIYNVFQIQDLKEYYSGSCLSPQTSLKDAGEFYYDNKDYVIITDAGLSEKVKTRGIKVVIPESVKKLNNSDFILTNNRQVRDNIKANNPYHFVGLLPYVVTPLNNFNSSKIAAITSEIPLSEDIATFSNIQDISLSDLEAFPTWIIDRPIDESTLNYFFLNLKTVILTDKASLPELAVSGETCLTVQDLQEAEKIVKETTLLEGVKTNLEEILKPYKDTAYLKQKFSQHLDGFSKINFFKNNQAQFIFSTKTDLNFGPTRMRFVNLYKTLERLGLKVKMTNLSETLDSNADYFIFSNHYDPQVYSNLKSQNKPIFLDIYEDLYKFGPSLEEAVKAADYVSACSPKLVEKTKQYQKNTFLVEDAVEVRSYYHIEHRSNDRLKFCWIGYASNLKWVKPIKDLLHQKNHILITVTESGVEFGDINYKWDLNLYDQLAREADVFILPGNSELEPCKSDNKLASLIRLGKPIISGDTPAYLDYYHLNPNFIICKSEEDWKEAIEKVENSEFSKKLGMKAAAGPLKNTIEESTLQFLEMVSQKQNVNKRKEKVNRLNIGCGNIKIPGFINLDVDPSFKPDIVGDILNLPFEDDSVEFILLSHVLSQFERETEILRALNECHRVLSPTGTIDVLDLDAKVLAQHLLESKITLETYNKWAYGGSRSFSFDSETLNNLLGKAGFPKPEVFSLKGYPWVVVSDIRNPVPDPYHLTSRVKKEFLEETPDKALVDIIIPTLKGNEEYLNLCLESLENNTKEINYKIHIVKSNTQEKTLGTNHQEYCFQKQLSFAEAVNHVAKRTEGDYIVILNDDTVVSKNWLTNLRSGIDEQHKIICPYSNCDYNWMHQDRLSVEGLDLIETKSLEQIKSVKNELQNYTVSKESKSVDWVAFYAVMLERTVLDRVGLLDEHFLNGGEDFDFCNRARAEGYKCKYSGESFVYHFGKVSRGKNIEKYDQHNQKRAYSKQNPPRDLVFYAGPAWENWNTKNIYQGGIGGSETMLALLAEEFASRNYKVTVFNQCEDREGLINGVEYIDYKKFDLWVLNNSTDIFVSSRVPWIFDRSIKAKKFFCWVHDIWLHNDPKAYIGINKVHKYLVLSPWHEEFFSNHHRIDKDRLYITKNAIDLRRFDLNNVDKQNHRLIYSSSPDRGLDVLLSVFPQIKEKVPNCELNIFYGFENWEKAAKMRNNQVELQNIDRLKNMMKQPGVFYHGRISQEKLAEEFKKASLWAYPTNFTETFCITALEAMAAGTPIVCSDYAGLSETAKDTANFVYHGTYKNLDSYSATYQSEFLEKVVNMLTNQSLWEHYQKLGYEKVKEYTFNKLADQWEKNLF